ncbi:MAG: T9SS type A sorting domain-containing protein [Calditrichaeota bacterium]|nr:T9SS type A sorting domain-containing protein [Calditrichota bacterium]
MNFRLDKNLPSHLAYSILSLFVAFFLSVSVLLSQTAAITVSDTIYQTLGADFFGIQYHADTYDNNNATDKLAKLKLQRVRIWAKVADFHPAPNVWNWEELDKKVAEITSLNYKPLPCIYQSEQWFTGTPTDPWWNDADGLAEWEAAVFEFANRYKNDLDMIIFFDEPNMLYPDRDYYLPFKKCAQLFLRAAKQVKNVKPEIQCGGPSSFGGWENGHWANYVLNEPEGKNDLDFVSVNLFISWDGDDSDALIMDRTIWYEEAPLKIKDMVGGKWSGTLVLDAYNVSAVWKKDGELWTDPRNTNIFGGVYQAAALLHGAKGGFDITLHWETIGGYGILNWFPEFRELPPYFSWKFLIDVAGLKPDAQIIGCATNETPKSDVLHHGGMNVHSYVIQPFAIRRVDGGVSVILINKYNESNRTATISVPDGMNSYEIFRYAQNRITSCFSSVESGQAIQTVPVDCPPFSISIVKFSATTAVETAEKNICVSENENLLSNFPNPFNSLTQINYRVPKSGLVELKVLNLLGQTVRTLFRETQPSGSFHLFWDGKDYSGNLLTSGVYLINLQAGNQIARRKILYLK